MAETRPETRDVWPRALLLFACGLVIFLLVALGGLYLIFRPQALWPSPGAEWSDNDASPALSTSPYADLAAIRKEEDAELERLAWVDRDKGIARIPIEDAMRLVAEDGLPDRADETSGGACELLTNDVPRAPQTQDCRQPAGAGP